MKGLWSGASRDQESNSEITGGQVSQRRGQPLLHSVALVLSGRFRANQTSPSDHGRRDGVVVSSVYFSIIEDKTGLWMADFYSQIFRSSSGSRRQWQGN